MIHYFLKSAFQYFLILLILTTSLIVLFLLPERAVKTTIIFGLSSLYVIWGIYHHLEKGDLKLSTLLEYLVLAAFTWWILLSIIA